MMCHLFGAANDVYKVILEFSGQETNCFYLQFRSPRLIMKRYMKGRGLLQMMMGDMTSFAQCDETCLDAGPLW